MLAQFDHLAETYFDGFEQDLGERELGYALSFDHDLDVFAASIGLTRTSVAAILNDEGVLHPHALSDTVLVMQFLYRYRPRHGWL
jgi:dynactin 1